MKGIHYLSRFGFLLAAVSVVPLLASCGGDGGKKPETTLRVGYQQGSSATLSMIAREEKYFDKVGVKTDFTLFTGSTDGLSALNVGKLDVGVSFGTCAPLTFAAKGSKLVIIGGSLSGGHPVMVKRENAEKYRSVRDFRGRTVGSTRVATFDVVFRGALLDAGIDPVKDLTIVEFKRALDVMEAVKSGKIEVGLGTTNTIGRSLQAGLVLPLWSNDFFPNHPCCRIVATEEAIRTKRPELVKFLKAVLMAEKKFVEDRESGVRAAVNQQKFSEKLARELVLDPHYRLAADPDRKAVTEMWFLMKRIGYVDREIDLTRVIDTSLYHEALQQLRSENADPYWEKLEQRYGEQNL